LIRGVPSEGGSDGRGRSHHHVNTKGDSCRVRYCLKLEAACPFTPPVASTLDNSTFSEAYVGKSPQGNRRPRIKLPPTLALCLQATLFETNYRVRSTFLAGSGMDYVVRFRPYTYFLLVLSRLPGPSWSSSPTMYKYRWHYSVRPSLVTSIVLVRFVLAPSMTGAIRQSGS
jgi:hypothetical protein